MNFRLKVWRQKNAQDKGRFEQYEAKNIPGDASFLEMLDIVNNELELKGIEPVAFDHDCREGICGSCGMYINGRAHGPKQLVTTCQQYMRDFAEGSEIVIEPFRAKPFPVLRDLVVDRAAFDRIIQQGGYVSVNTGSAPDANSIPIAKPIADQAFDAAQCIGCGACVAACKNASAMLFVSAKVSHLALLPQGDPERRSRVRNMVAQMDVEGFGNCSNTGACEAECPKGISLSNIALMNREYLAANVTPKQYE
jgi:succinate dehydrogenase / fumarate reductase iron-sulfur subunit